MPIPKPATIITSTAVTNDLVGYSVENTFTAQQSFSSVCMNYDAKTANYTITTEDYTIDCTSGTFTVTLPTAVGTAGYGQVYNIKNSGTGVITVVTTSSQTIDGETTQTLFADSSMCVHSKDANWIII